MNSDGTALGRPVLRGSCSAPTKRRIPTPVCGLARNDRERDVVEAVSYSAIQREALSLRTSDRVTGVAIRYPPPPSAREVSARSGDGGRDSAHPRAGHMGPALQSTAGMLRDGVPDVPFPVIPSQCVHWCGNPLPSAREVSARSDDGGRDSAYPTAGHMGPALQSTAGMLTGTPPPTK